MKKTVFESSLIVIFSDGSYECSDFGAPSCSEQRPSNEFQMFDAREAVSLGLPVEIPEPVWILKDGVATAPREEIEDRLARAKASLKWIPSRISGKEVLEWRWEHADSCCCGNCYGEPIYGDQDKMDSGWEPDAGIIPEEWYVPGSRDRVKVQTPDGRYLFEGRVAGIGCSGTLLSPGQARWMCPGIEGTPAFRLLEERDREWAARRDARIAAQNAKRREELARKFGIPNVV